MENSWLCSCSTLNENRSYCCTYCGKLNPKIRTVVPVQQVPHQGIGVNKLVPINRMPSTPSERIVWWNRQTEEWKKIFGKQYGFNSTLCPPDYVLETIFDTTRLDISNITVSDLSGISQMQKLLELQVPNCGITNLLDLKNLTKIKMLGVSNNQILSFKGLENMKELRNIYASNNPLKTLSHLYELKALRYIDLKFSTISSLETQHLRNRGVTVQR